MRSNKDLTMTEFHISNNIKRALLHMRDDPEYARTFLYAALKTIYN